MIEITGEDLEGEIDEQVNTQVHVAVAVLIKTIKLSLQKMEDEHLCEQIAKTAWKMQTVFEKQGFSKTQSFALLQALIAKNK